MTRRLRTIAGFYKYAVEEELLDRSPPAHVRRPRVDYESHAAALDRNELGAMLVAAGLGPPPEHALISLLALNGLRVSEATARTSSTSAWNAATGLSRLPARAAKSSSSRWHRDGPGNRSGHRRAHRRAGVPWPRDSGPEEFSTLAGRLQPEDPLVYGRQVLHGAWPGSHDHRRRVTRGGWCPGAALLLQPRVMPGAR